MVGHAVNDVYWFIFPLLIPLIQADCGISYVKAGFLLTAYRLSMALFAYLSGALSDTLGREATLAGGFWVTATGLIAVSISRSYTVLILSTIAVGAGVSTFHPAAYAAIGEMHDANRGRAYGVFECVGTLGILVFLVVAGILTSSVTWRHLVAGAALPAGIVGGVLLLQWRPSLRSVARATDRPHSLQRTSNATAYLAWQMAFFGGLALRGLGITATISFIPTYLADHVGMKPSAVSFASALVFVGGLIASWIVGTAADRWSPMRLLKLICAASIPIFSLLGFIRNTASLLIILVAAGAAWLGMFPPLNTVMTSLGHQANMGELFGILSAITMVADSIAPSIAGLVADRFGLVTAIRSAPLPMILGLLIVVAVDSMPKCH